MNISHNIKITIHIKENENKDIIEKKLFSLIPLTKQDITKNKITQSKIIAFKNVLNRLKALLIKSVMFMIYPL